MNNIRPSAADYLKHAKYFIHILFSFTMLAARRGPISLLRDMRRYPWLFILLRAPLLMGRLAAGRTGLYREANELLISFIVKQMIDVLVRTLKRDDTFILHQEMVPPEISTAMGLSVWPAELLSILLPLLDSHAAEAYIDRSENEGIPPDICSHVKMTLGIVLSGEMPPASVIVSSNLPCDGNMTGYEITRRKNNAKIFRLDIPFNFYNNRAVEYFAGELKRMIAWLEENTPGRMDWERLRQICEERNRMAEKEIELWEMISARPAPMAAEPVYLGHLWAFNADPGNPAATRFFHRIADMTRRNLESGVRAVPNERFRAVLWNPPLLHFSELFRWAEEAYGITLVIDSMTYNSQPLIDTSTPDTMLRDLGKIIMQGPMARHTRGPAENYIDDIFRIYHRFNLDMVWVAGHIGCKNTMALNQMLREACREKGVPLLIIEYDLSDQRICSHEGIIRQIDHFMQNVMKVNRNGEDPPDPRRGREGKDFTTIHYAYRSEE
ncbi:MAG TPA: 2-hydroxyacyl-CoA dehydratase family protein [Spirochaetota bacterium]|nr:2-hydroxyacyl-CoA dehydratase family protein [Spirochaetota bacterium]